MNVRTYGQQKAALTRALKSGDPGKVVRECKRVKIEWGNAWPDDWSRWERALWDVGDARSMDEV